MPDEKYTTTMFLGGPEIRYYINGAQNLKYWLKGSPSLGVITSTYDGKDVHTPKRLYQFSGAAGLSYFTSSLISIDMGLTYNVFTIRNKGSYTGNSRKEYVDSIGFDVGLSFYF
jgi:hypothetical protein